jgi:sensor histidine kinase regulating citrate/malate metabolism
MRIDKRIFKKAWNLIQNSRRNGYNVTSIHFSMEEHDGVHALVCEDDGVGISAVMKEKMFTKGSGNDHGHGLFLSREILSITGINIVEEGMHGRGVKFIITVPTGEMRINEEFVN